MFGKRRNELRVFRILLNNFLKPSFGLRRFQLNEKSWKANVFNRVELPETVKIVVANHPDNFLLD